MTAAAVILKEQQQQHQTIRSLLTQTVWCVSRSAIRATAAASARSSVRSVVRRCALLLLVLRLLRVEAGLESSQ